MYSQTLSKQLVDIIGAKAIIVNAKGAKSVIDKLDLKSKGFETSPAECMPLASAAELVAMKGSELGIAADIESKGALTATKLPSGSASLKDVVKGLEKCDKYDVSNGGISLPFTSTRSMKTVDGIDYYTLQNKGGEIKPGMGTQVVFEHNGTRYTVSPLDATADPAALQALAHKIGAAVKKAS